IAGIEAAHPSIRKALTFVERCQNFPSGDETSDRRFADGGFFFSPTDPVRNKAGLAGEDLQGRPRFRSYGSATADGRQALLRSGLPADNPRVAAARAWLESHFTPSFHPGTFEPIREVERDATYFYYCWSAAHAFRALVVAKLRRGDQKIAWAELLAREL